MVFFFSGETFYHNRRTICPNNCGRSFKHKYNMNYHYKKECGFNFICAICKKKFSQNFSLKRHVALVHKCIPE